MYFGELLRLVRPKIGREDTCWGASSLQELTGGAGGACPGLMSTLHAFLIISLAIILLLINSPDVDIYIDLFYSFVKVSSLLFI